uniref:Uncharacterized protein n=1 Tax=Gadus morhua TaxID=8049 RepID=A0A8C5FXB2_GADMO
MCASNVSHLPTKITAKDREKHYPCILHESGGKLFCTACNIVVEHKHKSSIDKHFATAKHNYRTTNCRQDVRRRGRSLTQAVACKSIASAQRINNQLFLGPFLSVFVRLINVFFCNNLIFNKLLGENCSNNLIFNIGKIATFATFSQLSLPLAL